MSHSASAGDRKGERKVVNSWTSSDSEAEQEKSNPRRRSGPLDSMASLEAALPMKRGLSKNYDGKSKPFGNLTELGFEDAKDMVKKEHPINKTRRLITANDILFDKIKSAASPSSSMSFSPSDDHKHGDDEEDDGKNQEEDGK